MPDASFDPLSSPPSSRVSSPTHHPTQIQIQLGAILELTIEDPPCSPSPTLSKLLYKPVLKTVRKSASGDTRTPSSVGTSESALGIAGARQSVLSLGRSIVEIRAVVCWIYSVVHVSAGEEITDVLNEHSHRFGPHQLSLSSRGGSSTCVSGIYGSSIKHLDSACPTRSKSRTKAGFGVHRKRGSDLWTHRE